MAVLGSNLYVVFVMSGTRVGGVSAIGATIPSVLVTVFFLSAYANEVSVLFPMLPLLPWPVIWEVFFGASGTIAVAMATITHERRIISRTPL